MPTRFPLMMAFTLGTMIFVPLASAQPSILALLLMEQESLVTVQAENVDLFQTPVAIAAFDRATGRLLLTRRVSKAAFQRAGAGVIIHHRGIIVTNGHIIDKAKVIKVILADRTVVPARVVRLISNIDLALLEIDPPYPLKVVPLADSDQVKLGDEIFSIGNSALLDETVSGGKIIGLGSQRSRPGPTKTNELLQTTITLYAGDSGGPLFDRQGRLVGLMTAKEKSSDHSSFAVPSNKIAQHLIDYIDKKSKIQHHGP